jgi:hypothetical protein
MFTVSTDTEEYGRLESRSPELSDALRRLCGQLRRLDVVEFTVERIDVHYEPLFD